jgi:hypothetical protein
MRAITTFGGWLFLLLASVAAGAPAGFVKTTIPLDAPPVGLAFDAEGVLWTLEGAPFGSHEATLRAIWPDGTLGEGFPVVGDDPSNFFVGSMAYDPLGDRLLVSDNTADGRLYAISKSGVQQTLAAGIAGVAGVAVRGTGEIFVSTAPFGQGGEVLEVDRATGAATPVLGGLGFGAGLAFDLEGDLIVQDADDTTFLGRLQRLPITETPEGLEFGAASPLLSGMESAAGVAVDREGDLFTTGSGGLFRIAGAPLAESAFDDNGNEFQFATAIAFDAGANAFEPFAGPDGGRLAYMADFGFAAQDTFVTLLTPAEPGDFNADGGVNDQDYAAWRVAYGSAEQLSADGNRDGRINAADYVIWRRNTSGTASATSTRELTAPEPAGAPLFMVWAMWVIRGRRDAKRRGLGRTQARPRAPRPGLRSARQRLRNIAGLTSQP